jgi:glycoside/pentoside/hexuronide:cation symporter, GPH family
VFLNKPFMLLCSSFLGAYLATQFLVANFYLYVQYVLKAEDQVVFLIIILQCSIGVAVIAWQKISLTIGKKPVYYIGLSIGASCTVWLIFLKSVFWLYPGCIFLGIGIGAIFLVPFSLVPEIIDLDEQKAKCRREGVYYGLFIFLQKMATSVGLALGSICLGLAGLDSGSDDDPPNSVLIVLRILAGFLPTLLYLISFIPMCLYPYGKKNAARKEISLDVDLDDLSEYQPPEVVLENSENKQPIQE